jgi:Reverse transcriptase (RNA-dependent DNA polymerase)
MKDANSEFVIIIEEKEMIFRKMAFPDPIASSINIPISTDSSINAISSFITEEDIEKALFKQSIKKASRPDKLNFKALRLLWSWDKARIQALILQCFNQGIHPKAWKMTKGILLRKPNKSDYSIAKSYRVISLLNCLGKVAEKVAATAITNFYEAKKLLHKGQFGYRKQRNAIDAVAKLIYTTEKA